MKITFIQPRYFNIWEALGLAYIGAWSKKQVSGLEMNFFQGYFDDDPTIISGSSQSDIVAFSCTSPTFGHALHIATELKKSNPSVRTVFGGVHPSALPIDCLENDCVDQVITGEGEEAFVDILRGNNDPLVRGTRFNHFSSISPDRELIRNNRTIDLCEQLTGTRITSFQSVRVCPFRCAFCAERIITGPFHAVENPIRERDPGHLLDEIEEVSSRYVLDYFKFVDATWNTSVEKVFSFCEKKISRDFTLPWEANVHAAMASREMLKIMKKAGCHQINVGCESGNPAILKDIRKGVTVDKISKVFRWGQEIGIERRGFFLMGMPNETPACLRMTEELVEEIKPDVFGITILCPYPGSDFYDPRTMGNYDWSFADEYSNPYWHTDHFTNAELKSKQGQLMDKFSSSLAWHNKLVRENRKVGHD